MAEPALLYEKEGHIATLTMNRPEARNAINPEMLCRFADAWEDVNNDAEIRVAILTGTGEDAFCAGADLDKLVRMMQGQRPPESEFDERIRNDINIIYKGLMRSLDVVKPIVAAVKGFCVAGGLEILNCCDIRVAAEDAQFGLAEVKWSLFPMGGSTVRIPRQIPWPITTTRRNVPSLKRARTAASSRSRITRRRAARARSVQSSGTQRSPIARQPR